MYISNSGSVSGSEFRPWAEVWFVLVLWAELRSCSRQRTQTQHTRKGVAGEEEIEPQRGTHIVFLAETEETADLGRALWTQALGVYGVGETWNVCITLLDDRQSEDRQVHGDDASTNRLSLALSSAAWAVAAVAIGEEESDTSRVHDTLLHWETLLVVAAGDSEDVALELVADAVTWDFLTHAAVHEDTELALIFNVDELLRAIGWEGDVKLHLDWCSSKYLLWLVSDGVGRTRLWSEEEIRGLAPPAKWRWAWQV